MTDPIIDRLDQIKSRADKATEGPWWADRRAIGTAVQNKSFTIASDLTNGDGEFAAAARTDVPRIEAALRAVLDHLSQWQVPDPCEGPRDQWCPDCLRNDEIRQAVADALGVETEGGEK